MFLPRLITNNANCLKKPGRYLLITIDYYLLYSFAVEVYQVNFSIECQKRTCDFT